MKASPHWLWLALVTLLAAILRFYRLDSLPPGLWFDEAWISLQARQVQASGDLQVYFASGEGGIAALFVYLTSLARIITRNDPLAIRYAAAAVGVLTTLLTFFALRAVLQLDGVPARPSAFTALLGALVFATAFPNILLHRVGFESILPAPAGALALWAFAQSQHTRRARFDVLCGLALGLAQYTYSAARLLPFVVIGAAAWLAWRSGDWKAQAWPLGRSLLIALGVFLPLGLYFLQSPEAFAHRAILTSYNTLGPGAASAPLAVLANLLRTLVGFSLPGFGDVLPRHNLPGRPFFDPFLSLLLWLGVVWLVLHPRPSSGILGIWGGVMLLPVILTDGAPTFPRMLGAMPALAGWCAVGGSALFRILAAYHRRLATLAISLGLLFSLMVTAYDYFIRWANDPRLFDAFQVGEWQAASRARDLATYGPVYLTANLINPAHPTFDLLLSDSPVKSFPGPDCLVYYDPPAHPMTYWIDALSPDATQIADSLQQRFPASHKGEPILHEPEPFPLFEVIEVPAGSQAAPPASTAEGDFGGLVRLTGYDLRPATPHAGEALTLRLFWQALAPMEADYTVFVHLFVTGEESASPRAQSDAQPCEGAYPTSSWATGEMVMDTRTLLIPTGFPADQATLVLGLYAWPSLERLPLAGTMASLPDNRLRLAEISLGP
jgi:hypothetical protein